MDLPEQPVIRELVERYARLLARLGDEMGARPMVLPDAESFPDPFTPDAASLERLARRMIEHAGMSDIPIRVTLAEADDDADAQCGTGGCCSPSPIADQPVERVVDEGDGWRLAVPAAELAHPVVLTANLARALALIFLMETRDEHEPIEQPLDATVDLAAVALGFGALVMQGAYIYAKSCGGPRIASVTTLSVPELAVALALFAGAGGHPLKRAKKLLDTTQASALGEAQSWIESNAGIAELLRTDAARAGRGDFEISESRPWLLRAFGRKKAPPAGSIEELEASIASVPIAKRAARPDPRHDEIASLVAEELGSR